MTSLNQPVSSYAPQLLSHQTGLSVAVSTANTFYNIGTAISIPRNGIVKVSIIGYVSSANSDGFIGFSITRGSNTYSSNSGSPIATFSNGTSNFIILANNDFAFEIAVLSGDSLQITASENTAGITVYITDLVVVLQ